MHRGIRVERGFRQAPVSGEIAIRDQGSAKPETSPVSTPFSRQTGSSHVSVAAITTVAGRGDAEMFLEQPVEVAEAEDADVGRNH